MKPLLAAACLLVAGHAHGATLYKCVGADGKTSYSNLKCTGKLAASKEIDVYIPPRPEPELPVPEPADGPAFRPPNPVPQKGDPAFLSEAHRLQYLQLQQADNMRRKAEAAEKR
jgi:hypothetical protein